MLHSLTDETVRVLVVGFRYLLNVTPKLVLPLLEIEKELAKQRQGERTDLQLVGNISHKSPSKGSRKLLTAEQKEKRNLKAKQKREKESQLGIVAVKKRWNRAQCFRGALILTLERP